MGDAAISALVREVVGRLTSIAIQEISLVRGLKGEIASLQRSFDEIQAVLQDAEEKHIKEKAVALWLKTLRSASLEVENVLDEISTQALLQRLYKQRVVYRVRAFFSSKQNSFMSRVRIAHKVRDIRKKLDDIASKRFELNLTPSADISHVDDMDGQMPDRETCSLVLDSSSIFGRDEEMERVTENICNTGGQEIYDNISGGIRVYGIWGMGGVGKTTLAQLVYNHQRVTQNFNLKCWAYVSENFRVQDIIKKLIESIDKCECNLTQLETLQESLQSKLRGKKFLIVLDDVWIEYNEKNKWDQLSEILSCGVEGSIILTTTRSHTTSRMMAKVPELQHKLGCLSEEDAWLLFKKLAFAQGREGHDVSELEPIGREIVEKCKGLPLAVKTLGSLMWSKGSTSYWQHVKDSNLWELEEINVLPAILKLSYDNLLPHIKRCFAYCCLFPKGFGMEKYELITLWVSNDFIPPKGGHDMYILGEEIFNCLVWRSFFIAKANSRDDEYVMHDLMHDMARHVMGDDCLVIESGKEVKIPNGVIHLSSSCPEFHFSPQDLEKLTSLRSVFMFGRKYKCNISQIFNQTHLRVLYLRGVDLNRLPKSVCNLKHLKYFNLSDSSIEVLSESIIYLQNLQILRLKACMGLKKLPKGLRYMTNLQHLDITYCFFLLHLPRGIKELTSLRTLSRFPLSKNLNRNLAKIGELGNLDLLEGNLDIGRLEFVGGLSEAKSANLKCKTKLSNLSLRWSNVNAREDTGRLLIGHDEEVLEGLEPTSNLKELSIWYYGGKIISPSWMMNLKDLVEITFYGCKKCEHISSLGRLPNLRAIELIEMDSLKCFHDDDTTEMFLSLQKLYISECPVLDSLPNNLSKLEVLSLKGCKLLSKRYEKEIGVDWHKISHIPDIQIDPFDSEDDDNKEKRRLMRLTNNDDDEDNSLERSRMMVGSPLVGSYAYAYDSEFDNDEYDDDKEEKKKKKKKKRRLKRLMNDGR